MPKVRITLTVDTNNPRKVIAATMVAAWRIALCEAMGLAPSETDDYGIELVEAEQIEESKVEGPEDEDDPTRDSSDWACWRY